MINFKKKKKKKTLFLLSLSQNGMLTLIKDMLRVTLILAVFISVSSQLEEDDEVVVVEDVAVDDVLPKHFEQNNKKHSSTKDRKNSKSRKDRSRRSGKTTPEEVFKMVEGNLKKVEKTMSQFASVEDGVTVVNAAEEMEKDWDRFEIHRSAAIANYSQDAVLHKDVYEKAEAMYNTHEKLKAIVQSQVMMHHMMMKSALEVMGSGSKYKNLRKYAKTRLKSKNLSRMLSSKENIVEFINVINKKRGAKLWGLSDNEMLQFIGFGILPCVTQMVLKWLFFKYFEIESGSAVDYFSAAFPPMASAGLVVFKAGLFFLSTKNLIAIGSTSIAMSVALIGFSNTVTASSLFSRHISNADRIKLQMHKKIN